MMFDPPQSTCMCIRNKGDKNNNKEQLDMSPNYNFSPQQNTRPLVQQKHAIIDDNNIVIVNLLKGMDQFEL